jgi:hypothetical protein
MRLFELVNINYWEIINISYLSCNVAVFVVCLFVFLKLQPIMFVFSTAR